MATLVSLNGVFVPAGAEKHECVGQAERHGVAVFKDTEQTLRERIQGWILGVSDGRSDVYVSVSRCPFCPDNLES